MTANPILGTGVFLIGGMAAALYLLPFRAVKGWAYETGWLVSVLAGWLVFPLVFDACVIPDLGAVLAQGGWPVLARTVGLGALWGVGALCWALMVRYLAAGGRELDEAAPIDAGVPLGLGLLIAVAAAVTPALLGGSIFQSYEAHLLWWGVDVHLVSSTVFDVAVYLIVMGMILDVARSLGAGVDFQDAEGRTPLPLPESTSAISARDRGELR